jgi:hypothetical protein
MKKLAILLVAFGLLFAGIVQAGEKTRMFNGFKATYFCTTKDGDYYFGPLHEDCFVLGYGYCKRYFVFIVLTGEGKYTFNIDSDTKGLEVDLDCHYHFWIGPGSGPQRIRPDSWIDVLQRKSCKEIKKP